MSQLYIITTRFDCYTGEHSYKNCCCWNMNTIIGIYDSLEIATTRIHECQNLSNWKIYRININQKFDNYINHFDVFSESGELLKTSDDKQ